MQNNQRRRAQTQVHLDRQQAQIDVQRRQIKQMQRLTRRPRAALGQCVR